MATCRIRCDAVGVHIDIKARVAQHLGWRQPKGLHGALAALGMQFEGRKHSARDDAVNAARVLYRALQTDSVR